MMKKNYLEQIDAAEAKIRHRHELEREQIRENKAALAKKHKEELANFKQQQTPKESNINIDPLQWKYLKAFTERSTPKQTTPVPISQSMSSTMAYSFSAPSSSQLKNPFLLDNPNRTTLGWPTNSVGLRK